MGQARDRIGRHYQIMLGWLDAVKEGTKMIAPMALQRTTDDRANYTSAATARSFDSKTARPSRFFCSVRTRVVLLGRPYSAVSTKRASLRYVWRCVNVRDVDEQEIAKKRTRRTVKQQRGIVGAPLELIKDRRSQRPEAREAARKEAIAKGKLKKTESESKKKAEKAKSASGAARGQPGRIQSKMGAKGVPTKVSAKSR